MIVDTHYLYVHWIVNIIATCKVVDFLIIHKTISETDKRLMRDFWSSFNKYTYPGYEIKLLIPLLILLDPLLPDGIILDQNILHLKINEINT